MGHKREREMIKVRYRKLLGSILSIEVICFMIVTHQGPQGFAAIRRARQNNDQKKQELVALGNEVEGLKRQIYSCETDSFYREKVARESLQMARRGDIIYYLTV
jgi:cell division protein FtsB